MNDVRKHPTGILYNFFCIYRRYFHCGYLHPVSFPGLFTIISGIAPLRAHPLLDIRFLSVLISVHGFKFTGKENKKMAPTPVKKLGLKRIILAKLNSDQQSRIFAGWQDDSEEHCSQEQCATNSCSCNTCNDTCPNCDSADCRRPPTDWKSGQNANCAG